jgi:uncharacterized protein (TIGR02147 family)
METQTTFSGYREWLAEIYEQTRVRNKNYSLRAFAHRLGVSPGAMSQILSGKRALSYKTASRMAQKLQLPSQDRSALFESLTGNAKHLGCEIDVEYSRLSSDIFEVISDWFYFPILCLVEISNGRIDFDQISRRLGIARELAVAAFFRLKRLGLLENDERGKYIPKKSLCTTNDIPDEAIRKYHSRVLHKADESLNKDDVAERSFSAMTIALNSADLPEAKAKIDKFRRHLAQFLERGKKKRVYKLAIQLFPVDCKRKTGSN